MDSAVLAPDLSKIKLNEASVKGLVPIQVEQMKQTAYDVNEALGVAGKAYMAAAEALWTLKKNLRHGNFTAFLDSGVLDISPKAASDLVSAYQNWLKDAKVAPYVLATMTPRSLAAVGNAEPDARAAVLAKVMGGTKISEAEVRRIIKGDKPAKKKSSSTDALLEAAGSQVIENVKGKAKSIKEIVALEQENERLKAENAKLLERIDELERELTTMA